MCRTAHCVMISQLNAHGSVTILVALLCSLHDLFLLTSQVDQLLLSLSTQDSSAIAKLLARVNRVAFQADKLTLV